MQQHHVSCHPTMSCPSWTAPIFTSPGCPPPRPPQQTAHLGLPPAVALGVHKQGALGALQRDLLVRAPTLGAHPARLTTLCGAGGGGQHGMRFITANLGGWRTTGRGHRLLHHNDYWKQRQRAASAKSCKTRRPTPRHAKHMNRSFGLGSRFR